MNWPAGEFPARIIGWQRHCGRHGLPWQGSRDPYRVWLSEIMLQQTQVSTVLDYYPRFLHRFPNVRALAAAPLDEVLGLWSGLGYYRRARMLHRCAQHVTEKWGGSFPHSAAELEKLPGIGRSTAAAIAAFCWGERRAILDGNVKRVLARVFAIDDDLSRAAPMRALWARAETLLPTDDLAQTMPAYTQGLMDLGATICKPRQPLCGSCPLVDRCLAAASGQIDRYPVRAPRPERQRVELWLLHATDEQGRVWLVQRPENGIWARLYCLPVHASRAELMFGSLENGHATVVEHATIKHALTHRELILHMVSVCLSGGARPDAHGAWFDAGDWPGLGLPAPVRRFLAAQASGGDEISARPARGGVSVPATRP